jgi:hypothetical protein
MPKVSLCLSAFLFLACTTTSGELTPDAGVDRFAGYGEPLEAPARQWTWVPFEGSACGNGEPVGLSINLSPGASEVLLYLEGGGLCWDEYTCNQQQTATFVKSGYNRVDAEDFASQLGSRGIFDRDAASNPFAGHHFLYVPYCTGDLHAGTREEESPYGVTHTGYQNIGAFLHRVVPTFPDVDQVVLAGTSAGGFGALFNYDRVRRAFDVPVHLLLDSSPPFGTDLIPLEFQNVQRAAWELDPALPEGCHGCEDLFGTFSFLLERWPDMRVGLISSLQDSTLRFLIGLGLGNPNAISGSEYRAALVTLLDEGFAGRPGAEMLLIPGSGHVFVYMSSLTSVVVDGVSLSAFMGGVVDGNDFRTAVPQ